MSLELVSRSLDLDIEHVPASSVKKKKKSTTKNAMELINTNRQGVWKELRKLQKEQKKEVIDKQKKRKMKSAIEKYQEENAKDRTEDNVEALLRITELGKVEDQVSEKILYKQPCRLSRDLKEEKKEEETSVFTEEDFKSFEKNYQPKVF